MFTAPHLLLLGLSSASAGDVRTWPGWDELPAATRQLSNPDCRVALVIGNATYPHATDVDNAARDARAVAALLRDSLGFTVDSDLNLGRQAQRDLVQRFLGRVQPGCVALVYYAGHAVQGGGGANYLLPVDMGKDDDPALQAVSLQYLLAQLKERKAVVRLAFLDACRTLVYDGERGSRSTDLAPVQGEGLFVGYAASPGQVADDGPAGGHSPFTAAFLVQAARPGLRVEQIFDGIQGAVSPTGQAPHGSDFLSGDFYFLPPAPAPAPPDLSSAWRAVLALPEAQRRDAVLAFAHQHAQTGAPEVAAALVWLMEAAALRKEEMPSMAGEVLPVETSEPAPTHSAQGQTVAGGPSDEGLSRPEDSIEQAQRLVMSDCLWDFGVHLGAIVSLQGLVGIGAMDGYVPIRTRNGRCDALRLGAGWGVTPDRDGTSFLDRWQDPGAAVSAYEFSVGYEWAWGGDLRRFELAAEINAFRLHPTGYPDLYNLGPQVAWPIRFGIAQVKLWGSPALMWGYAEAGTTGWSSAFGLTATDGAWRIQPSLRGGAELGFRL